MAEALVRIIREENVDWFDWLHFLFDHSNKVRLLPVSHENPMSRSILIVGLDLPKIGCHSESRLNLK